MGIVKAAMGDLLLTAMWIFTMPLSRIPINILLAHLGLQPNTPLAILVNTFSVSLLLLLFSILAGVLGGANFNPSTAVAFLAAGQGSGGSLLSAAVRFPAQAAGGVVGVKAILGLVPSRFAGGMRGPSLKVDLHTGAFVEGALTFVFCISVLLVVVRGPKNPLVKVWLLSNVTYGLFYLGFGFTGPSMNPANAFGWAFVNKTHDTWQHLYVYWVCPIFGSILAALVFRVFFSKPVEVKKEKKA